MDFAGFQHMTRETSMLPLGGPQGLVTPLLGLAGETGSILNVYKKYLRDGIDLAANREFLKEELGDLLWYTFCHDEETLVVADDLGRARGAL